MTHRKQDAQLGWESTYFSAPKYQAKPVPEQSGDEAIHPVVIVGAGPVGMTLALLLARKSIPVVLFEQGESVGRGSRAICISSRSLEILEECQVLDRLMSIALPWTGGKSYYRDQLVFEFEMERVSGGLPPMVNIQQCILEQLLVDAIEAEPLIDFRWCSTVVSVQDDGDVVVLDVASPLGSYEARSNWVAACDGPQSKIRDLLGLKLHGETHDGRYVIVDIHMGLSWPTERLCWFDPPSFPGKTVLMHKQPYDTWRLDYQLDGSESAKEATDPESVLSRVDRHLKWLGIDEKWELEWLSSYRAHSLTLDNFRHGRIIFAGDAAHLVPIFGVRGLNGGLADACNLSWKLAFVIQGAGTGILDSYSLEQRNAALANIWAASESARFMSPPTRATQLLRDAALSLALTQTEFSQLANPRQTTPATYRDSYLSIPDVPGDVWGAGPGPGVLAPNVLIAGEYLQSIVNLNPLLLVFGSKALDLDLPIKQVLVQEDTLMSQFGARDGSVYFLRPDRYVGGRWQNPNLYDVQNALAKFYCTKVANVIS